MPNDCRRGDITSVDYVVNQTQVAKFEAKKQQFRSAISARKKSLGHETPLSKCKKHFFVPVNVEKNLINVLTNVEINSIAVTDNTDNEKINSPVVPDHAEINSIP